MAVEEHSEHRCCDHFHPSIKKKNLCINNSSKQRIQSKGLKLLFGKLVILLPQKNNSS